MTVITTNDGAELYYKDWGEGPVVTFSHGWPLNADAWDGQMLFLAHANPEGLPIEVFDQLRAGVYNDRSQFYKDLAVQFYGANRPGANVSQGILDQFWLWDGRSTTPARRTA